MELKLLRSYKIIISILFIFFYGRSSAQILKSIVNDFDGLDINQTDLPENDYSLNDLIYKVSANPLYESDMLGDRVLQINLDWKKGHGSFVRGIFRYIEFDKNKDVFNFYFYNPLSNNQDANISVYLSDDDDNSHTYDYKKDDKWKKEVVISGSQRWQLISIPLKDFKDSNPGGNGIFDIAYSQNKGMLLQVEFTFNNAHPDKNAIFYMDMICFSEGEMPVGENELNLPVKAEKDYCDLGAYQYQCEGNSESMPESFEGLFAADPVRHLKYINLFIQFATDGSAIPKELPGTGVKALLDNGYTPVITWEPLYLGMPMLDKSQPRLDNIINGDYDSYIDDFADRLKCFNDTVIIRFMHEFDNNSYPWSIVENGSDPARFINAYRKVVDRFRARGATKVKWLWCVNATSNPSRPFNWFVKAYPGNNYIDIIGTDIYNNHYPENKPWWASFRSKAVESYYYITKYFPEKPVFICEFGCRERNADEPSDSQSKPEWIACMDKELQSNFHNVRALIAFSENKTCDWRINSSGRSLYSYNSNIWNDEYYFRNMRPKQLVKNKNTGSFLIAQITPDGPTNICEGSGVTLFANTGNNYMYQWKKDGCDIPGAMFSFYRATSTGNYQVKIISQLAIAWSAELNVTQSACKQNDSVFEMDDSVPLVVVSPGSNFQINVFPDPATGFFNFDLCLDDIRETELFIDVINSNGHTVFSKHESNVSGCIKESIVLDNKLSCGDYVLRLKVGDKTEDLFVMLSR